jgi:hypothetical protein
MKALAGLSWQASRKLHGQRGNGLIRAADAEDGR